MTTMKRLAAALVTILALSACAVTGQPANPGTAATYDGQTVTSEEVAAWGTAQTDMGLRYDPGAVLTLMLLRPALEAEAELQGMVFGEDDMRMEAKMWMAANNAEVVDPTADMIELVTTVRMVYAVLSTEGGSEAVSEALFGIEARANVSPMYGEFSKDVFVESVGAQLTEMQDESQRLGELSYMVFRELTGFDATSQRDWMVDEAPASASA
jgi:hypothetical protein